MVLTIKRSKTIQYRGKNHSPLATNFKESGIIYDRNGNIKNYQRWGSDGNQVMDNLTYEYTPGTNRLRHVKDAVSNNLLFTGDVDNQIDDNYTYDNSGNLIGDAQGPALPGVLMARYCKCTEQPWRLQPCLITTRHKIG